jgi:hypothetical protein
MTRPYWRSGRIELLIPTHFNLLFENARQHSRLMSALYNGLLNRSAATAHSVEDDIEAGRIPRNYEIAVGETAEVLRQIGKLTQGARLIGMAVDLKEPYLDSFRQIFRQLNIPLVEDAAIAVTKASAEGTDVFAGDGVHWNEAGHRIAGEALARALGRDSGSDLPRQPERNQ